VTALALMVDAHHNDTTMIDGLNGLFAPVIALMKANQLWGSSESPREAQLWGIPEN
jgi:hypothetical protein